MTFNPQQGKTIDSRASAGSTRRRTGRMEIESVVSNLGAVLNLSSGGMQILCSRTPKEPFTVELRGCETNLKLRGEIAWIRRVGFFKKIVGIHFVDLKAEQISQLTSLAMTNTVRRRIA